MLQALRAAAVVGLSILAAALLVGVSPFDRASAGLKRLFAAGPDWTQVNSFYRDVHTQEVSKGEQPRDGLAKLAQFWRTIPDSKRVVLVGNSQTLSTILAPGEPPIGTPEKTYPDFLSEHYRKVSNGRVQFYRLAAPNISYMEALWYLHYLVIHPDLKPDVVVLQLNYESLRKSGIRDGMLTLLEDEEFAKVIEQIAGGNQAFSGVFGQAMERWLAMRRQREAAEANSSSTKTGVQSAEGFGNRLENAVRKRVSRLPGLDQRHELKYSVVNFLYLARVYFLNLKPTTARSLGGATLAVSRASVEEIAAECQKNRIRLVILNAAQNPNAVLYKSSDDKRLYDEVIARVVNRFAVPFYDFEHSIPAALWGVWIDGPDPIHFGRNAHRRMADLLIESRAIDAALGKDSPPAVRAQQEKKM